ncbi:hypothetical protein AZF37_08910 [endosymbiont 'TC1' of Trimyema compressum]|nr:hypothetical protein AZF37_08910 [endosymbiont 'TC1' of Trimyema compressum]
MAVPKIVTVPFSLLTATGVSKDTFSTLSCFSIVAVLLSLLQPNNRKADNNKIAIVKPFSSVSLSHIN